MYLFKIVLKSSNIPFVLYNSQKKVIWFSALTVTA